MKIGFGKVDITPPLGVDLSGFGPYIRRSAQGVRDRLWARAMALASANGDMRLVIVSCDLVGLPMSVTRLVRDQVKAATGLPAEGLMLTCTHTHSGPGTDTDVGWGETHRPWFEILPTLIAQACLAALSSLRKATLSHAEVPCEGIARNREYDAERTDAGENSFLVTSPEACLTDGWRPNRPELADRTCHVLKAEADGRIIGFVSSFGCHPVVCCEATRQLHGDYCGVATSQIESEHPGAIGLFLQGAEGDINPGFVHQPEPASLRALDIIAGFYARAVREGLRRAQPLDEPGLNAVRQCFVARRKPWSLESLRALLAEKQRAVHADPAADDNYDRRISTVYCEGLRRMIARVEAGEDLSAPIETHGMRIGPLAFLGAPLEIFHAIKRDVVARATTPIPVVLSFANDVAGYAVDRETAARGGYAADLGPIILGHLPYADIHDETVAALLALDAALAAPAAMVRSRT